MAGSTRRAAAGTGRGGHSSGPRAQVLHALGLNPGWLAIDKLGLRSGMDTSGGCWSRRRRGVHRRCSERCLSRPSLPRPSLPCPAQPCSRLHLHRLQHPLVVNHVQPSDVTQLGGGLRRGAREGRQALAAPAHQAQPGQRAGPAASTAAPAFSGHPSAWMPFPCLENGGVVEGEGGGAAGAVAAASQAHVRNHRLIDAANELRQRGGRPGPVMTARVRPPPVSGCAMQASRRQRRHARQHERPPACSPPSP